MIMQGELQEGDALPSMRLLAKELRISLITTKRAYEELETMGLLVTVGGKGCFVGGASPEKLRAEQRRELENYLGRAAETAREGGISLTEAQEMLKRLYMKGVE